MVSFYKEGLPLMALVMVECTNVSTDVLFKAASSEGLSFYVFTSYSYLVGTLLLFPCIFLFNRNLEVPQNKFSLLSKILLLGLLGSLSQICIYKGITYSSPTLSSAMSNLVPAFTFLLAIVFRMEKLVWKCQSTQAKVIGTLVSIAGACVVTLYTGPVVVQTSTPSTSSWIAGVLTSTPSTPSTSNWITSGLLLAMGYLMLPIWYIVQAQIMKEYPAEVQVVFLYLLSAAIMCFSIGLMAETNPSSWKLRFDVTLAAILFAGFFVCIFCTTIHTWGIRLKGPVYIAMFKPLSIAIAAIMSFMFLGESLHLGSVIGAVIISAGFYAVLWGKAKEDTREELAVNSAHTSKQSNNVKVCSTTEAQN